MSSDSEVERFRLSEVITISPYSLQLMPLGHADIKTTTIYLSASVGMLREQIGKHPLA